MWAIILVAFCATLKYTLAVNQTLTGFLYTAVVVEYQPQQATTLEDTVNLNALEYIKLLNDTQGDLEIVLFPESTLGGSTISATEVPLPFTDIICNSNATKYQTYLKNFSCAAIRHNTTVVVNLIEKENCTLNNSTGFCPSSGIIYYNSNVAFNNSGGVIGRYRKWNLFGEYNKSPPAAVELVTITTKNNNTFGMFTCFDIMFLQPALNLTRDLGVKNILFPTMWFSELPYLTALQTQQMWAHENDVNFLSSGANSPQVGSGGTGIYIGKEGPLVQTIIGGSGGTTLFVADVPRPEVQNNTHRNVTPIQEDVDSVALQMDSFHLITDPSIGNYTSVVLNTSQTTTAQEVCNGRDIRICCEFNITISVNANVTNSTGNRYVYHLAAFNGIRSYSGVRNGGIESCGVLACLNNTTASCGQRFSNYSGVVWPVTFQNVTISANFTTNENRAQFPNSLLASIKPISPQYTRWSKEVYGNVTRRSLSLIEPQVRLLTFGIFGRDFSRDGGLIVPGVPQGNGCVRVDQVFATVLVFFLGVRLLNKIR